MKFLNNTLVTEFFDNPIHLNANASANNSPLSSSTTLTSINSGDTPPKKLNHLMNALEKIKISKVLLRQIEEEYQNKENKDSFF